MDGVIGRLQTEADQNGKRVDIQLETNIKAIKDYNGKSIESAIENMGLGVIAGTEKPTHSAIWLLFD